MLNARAHTHDDVDGSLCGGGATIGSVSQQQQRFHWCRLVVVTMSWQQQLVSPSAGGGDSVVSSPPARALFSPEVDDDDALPTIRHVLSWPGPWQFSDCWSWARAIDTLVFGLGALIALSLLALVLVGACMALRAFANACTACFRRRDTASRDVDEDAVDDIVVDDGDDAVMRTTSGVELLAANGGQAMRDSGRSSGSTAVDDDDDDDDERGGSRVRRRRVKGSRRDVIVAPAAAPLSSPTRTIATTNRADLSAAPEKQLLSALDDRPDRIDYRALSKLTNRERIERALQVAESEFGATRFFDAEGEC